MNLRWIAEIIDVKGAFLQSQFEHGEVMYIEVPDGMENYYGKKEDVVLLLNVPIYGTKQAASCFYKTLIKKMKDRGYERSKADPCLYFVWKENRLALMVSWVDDLLVLGESNGVEQIRNDLKEVFVCKCEGAMKEYVGNKIDFGRNENGLGIIKFTQPVLIQKLEDEFELPNKETP